jgi:hypothetical protein
MSRWSKDELRRIGEAEELQIAPFREDGVTYRVPTPVVDLGCPHSRVLGPRSELRTRDLPPMRARARRSNDARGTRGRRAQRAHGGGTSALAADACLTSITNSL